MTHALTLGALTLTGSAAVPDPTYGYWYEVGADGTDFGTFEAITRIVNSLLSDGDLVSYDRDGNRTLSVMVLVRGNSLTAVAQGEAALRRETKVANLLTWTPPLTAPSSVYETYPSAMPRAYETNWDQAEELYERAFQLRLGAAPFARSASLTTIAALPVGNVSTVVSTADATTGWSSLGTGSLSATGGYVQSTLSGAGSTTPGRQHFLSFSASNNPATPYYIIEYQTSHPLLGQVTLVDAPLVQSVILTDGWTRAVFDTTGKSLSSLPFGAFLNTTAAGSWFRIRELRRANQVPQITTRQFSRAIAVGGTERTPPSLHIESPDGATDLGLVIVSTTPGSYPAVGFNPAMSRWYTSGTRTPDATTVSGYRYRLDDNFFVATAPAQTFPEAGYSMTALVAASVAGTYEVVSLVQARKAGVLLKEWSNSEIVQLNPAPDWGLIDLGLPRLPILRAYSGTDVVMSIKVRNVNGSNLSGVTVEAQDAWLFPVDEDCGLTVVLTDKAHLWIDAPNPTEARPQIYEGDAADRTGATYPLRGVSGGLHILSPGSTGMTVIASIVENPQASATYYKRWPHNAAE